MIAFSGIDCSGKSTQIQILNKELESKDIKCKVIWSRGGYTSWIETVKSIVRKDKKYLKQEKEEYRKNVMKSSWKSRLLLYVSILDLIRFYGIVLRIVTYRGNVIICDRYLWDTYIDFKLKYPKFNFEKWICWKILVKVAMKPEHSFIFTIPADESMRRSEMKIEPFPETYEERVKRIAKYIEEIKKNRWDHVINGMKSIEIVTDEINRKINL